MSAEQATSNPAQPPDGSIKGCVSGRQCDRETIKSAGNFVITDPPSLISGLEPLRRHFTASHLIGRSQVSLDTIDTSNGKSRVFRGHIAALETAHGGSEDILRAKNQVLIARAEDGKNCVIEQLARGLYAQVELLQNPTPARTLLLEPDTATASALQSLPAQSTTQGAVAWWHAAAVRRCPKTSDNDLFARTGIDIVSFEHSKPRADTAASAIRDAEGPPDLPATVTSESAWQAFVAQYLDTLYLTKTSLAYFAKVSLPRLKATFDETQAKQELVNLLRTLILTSKIADAKYRDALPQALDNGTVEHISDHEGEPAPKKRKRSLKLAPNKQGLLPDELDYFGRWWRADVGMSLSSEKIMQRFRRRAFPLKTRESFLQLILILEVLLIESSSGNAVQTSQAGTNGSHDIEQAKTKKKAPVNLNIMLETILDRLCIWHSLDTGVAHEVTHDTAPTSSDLTPNVLREFCVDVIVPFYAARLVGPARTINQKLGGQLASPIKSKSSSRSKNKMRDKGKDKDKDMYMDKVTSDRKITREPLQRVTSETAQRWPAPVPSLHRSATDSQISLGSSDGRRPSLAGLKTNGSEQTLDKKRLSALDRLRIRQREVDFDVMSQASTSKKGKQAAIEASLKDAIGALKRPNRALVSAEVADAVAQRALMAKGRAKASQTQIMNKARSKTLVEATPSHKRTYDIMAIESTPQHARQAEVSGLASGTSSSVQFVPSSSSRLGSQKVVSDMSHTIGPDSVITATPSRGDERFLKPALPLKAIRFNSLNGSGATHVPQTPTKQAEWRMPGANAHSPMTGLEDAPVVADGNDVICATPEVRKDTRHGLTSHDGESEGFNIYDALGWND